MEIADSALEAMISELSALDAGQKLFVAHIGPLMIIMAVNGALSTSCYLLLAYCYFRLSQYILFNVIL